MIKGILRQSIERALQKLDLDSESSFTIERPPLPAYGDFSTNAAMIAASRAKQSPREVAEKLVKSIDLDETIVDRIEIAGPGFINFHLKPLCLHQVVGEVLAQGSSFGNGTLGAGKRVQVEFVSANPNGPIHVGHGRGGVIGDVLANLLAAIGYEVEREFYINDAAMSGQMQKFAQSLDARFKQQFGIEAEVPEDGYKGEYVIEIAKALADDGGEWFLKSSDDERLREFTRIGREKMLEWQKNTLEEFGIHFDRWFSEQTLHDSGKIGETIQRLQDAGATYESEGAVWLRSTDFGDDKDRVLVRSSGASTYLASDLAYHVDKFQRGFDCLIDVWGPDHHGYIARTKAGLAALGCDVDKLDIFIYQIVRLFRQSEEVKVSKRAGDIITLNEVVDEVGKDAARFFFLMRSHDSHLDFDLDLAKRQSADNPVYYVQYAHSRICSILREAEQRGKNTREDTDLSVLTHPQETALIHKLAELPEEIEIAATRFEPHRLTRYAQELASAFHVFYDACRVLGDDPELTSARLSLVSATRIVLQNTLGLLGVSAPERM